MNIIKKETRSLRDNNLVGIVGILKKIENNLNIEVLLNRMCNALKHERWRKIDNFFEDTIGLGRVYLGFVNPEPQPIFNEDKSILIMMEGEIFDYQNVMNELLSKGHDFSVNDDPEFLLHCYEEYELKMVNFLNGSFIAAIFDKKKNKLILINDRYGSRPLYYTLHNGCLLFSSEIKAILEENTFERKVNDEAVFDFFLWGNLLGNKTLFNGINLLPPASILEFEEDNLKLKQYWRIKFEEDYEDLPEEYYIAKLEKLILQAVKRQSRKKHKLGVFLSGGLDSRTIAAALHKNDPNFKFGTFTFGKNPHCDDARYAYAVSRKLGVPHHFFIMSPDYLASHSEKIVHMTDGMYPCLDGHGASVFGHMRQYCKISVGGALMDVMFSLLPEHMFNISKKQVLQRIIKKEPTNFNLNMISKLFAKDYYSQKAGLAWKSFKEAMKECKSKHSTNAFSYFLITQRTRRFVLLGVEFSRNYFECRTPFLDNDLVDFFLTVPPRLRAEVYLYSKMLKKLAPNLAKNPWQKRGMSLFASRYQVFIRRVARKLFNVLGVLIRKFSFHRIRLYHHRKDFHDYDEWIRKNKRVKKYFLSILLDNKTLNRKYFNPDYIKKLIQLHMNGKQNYSRQLASLLTFELWHRQFVDGKGYTQVY